MEYYYKTVQTTDQNGRICYGIEMVKRVQDVFENENEANEFTELCNKCMLMPEHFDDVIDDYLNR